MVACSVMVVPRAAVAGAVIDIRHVSHQPPPITVPHLYDCVTVPAAAGTWPTATAPIAATAATILRKLMTISLNDLGAGGYRGNEPGLGAAVQGAVEHEQAG